MTERSETEQEEVLEEIDNPIERLKLLSGDDNEIAKYLDAMEVTSPREREMLHEISRTRPLARPDLFPQAHRNMVEALESLVATRIPRHECGQEPGPPPRRYPVGSPARGSLRRRVAHPEHLDEAPESLRPPGDPGLARSEERHELRRARLDAERMIDALQTRELALPAFLLGGAALPIVASLGRGTGLLREDAGARPSSALWGHAASRSPRRG